MTLYCTILYLLLQYGKGHKPRRALIIYNPTDSSFSKCVSESNMKPVYESTADHIIGPFNALRAWSKNYTESGEDYFDITIYTRIKYSSTDSHWSAFANGRTKQHQICNLQASAEFEGKGIRCCNLENMAKQEPQGNEILKGPYCGCGSNPLDWEDKKCFVREDVKYWPYFDVVEHGGTGFNRWIDGPKTNEKDYIINTRTNYLEGTELHSGLFFSEPQVNYKFIPPSNTEYILRENGKYLSKPTYSILQKYNITELYFTGNGSFGIKRGIEEAQHIGYKNITILSDIIHGSYYGGKGTTEEEKKIDYLKQMKKNNITTLTSTEFTNQVNNKNNSTKSFNITDPTCIQNFDMKPKRALLFLDLQDGLLSSCNNKNGTKNQISQSHRITPRTNAFLEWSFKKKDFFSQIHFSQTSFTKYRTALNTLEYSLSQDLISNMNSNMNDYFKSNIPVYFSSRTHPSFFAGRVTRKNSLKNEKDNGKVTDYLRGDTLTQFLKNPTTLQTLWDKNITQLYLAGVALDDTLITTAREARHHGFSVFIITDLTQSHNKNLQEGKPKETLMRYYYNLADQENIFSIKSTDLSEEYFAEDGLYIQYSDWLDEKECIKKDRFSIYARSRSSVIHSYLIFLFLF